MKVVLSKMYSWRLDMSLVAALKKIQERDGISVTEQVRRALKAWIEKKGGKK